MRKIPSLDELWQDFKVVIPANAGPNQLRDMEVAFKSGMFIMMQSMKNLGDPTFGEEAALVQFKKWMDEYMDYTVSYMMTHVDAVLAEIAKHHESN